MAAGRRPHWACGPKTGGSVRAEKVCVHWRTGPRTKGPRKALSFDLAARRARRHSQSVSLMTTCIRSWAFEETGSRKNVFSVAPAPSAQPRRSQTEESTQPAHLLLRVRGSGGDITSSGSRSGLTAWSLCASRLEIGRWWNKERSPASSPSFFFAQSISPFLVLVFFPFIYSFCYW